VLGLACVIASVLAPSTQAVLDDVALEKADKLCVCQHRLHQSPRLDGHVFVVIAADDMEAAELMLEANDFFGYLNMAGAPPKEAFN